MRHFQRFCEVQTKLTMSVKGREDLYAQLVSKAVLHGDEKELYELSQLSGVMMNPEIFKILLDLLKLNVSPLAIVETLRSMCSAHPQNPRDENQPPSLLLASEEPHHATPVTDPSFRPADDRHAGPSYRGRSKSGERRGAHRMASSFDANTASASRYRNMSPPERRGASGSRGEGYSSRTRSLTSSAQVASKESDRVNRKRASYHN